MRGPGLFCCHHVNMLRAYRSVDHVVVRLLAAEPLYALFTETFGLPVAWPLQRTDFATYGWVHIGNTDLELWASHSNSDLPAYALPPLIHGFALEPALSLAESLARVEEAGIACKPPRAFQTQNAQGETVANFTNSVLLDVSASSCCIFFCEWNPRSTIYPWPEAATPAQRRAQHRQDLENRNGGPLGITGLTAIRMATPDKHLHQRLWCALSGSQPSQSIALAQDISLDLVPGEHLRVESLTLGVRSLRVARAFLADHQLLQTDAGDLLTIAGKDLSIHLREASFP